MMPNVQEEYRIPRVSLLLLIATGLIRFVNLGFLDMQAWDEALYAVRAETVSQFGLFLDQTAKAVDGLYSAFHPPLYVWLTALSYEIFGVSEFSTRFFSALFGALTLFVIHRTGFILRNERTGLIAALLYGLAPIVLFYSRQGQFDVTLVFFVSLSVVLLIQAVKKDSVRFGFCAGLSAGAALMTKMFVGLGIPLILFFWIFASGQSRSKNLWAIFGLLCTGAVLVAGPWHVYMTIVHGNGDPLFFLSASDAFARAISGFEGNVKPLGPLYYLNQLFVVFPFGVFWFAAALPSAFKKSDPLWLFVGLWFAVFFLVFSLMRTQLQVYILPGLVPAALLAACSMDRMISGEINRRFGIALLTGTALAAVWAASQDWRNAAKAAIGALGRLSVPSSSEVELVTHLALAALLILAGATFLWNRGAPQLISKFLVPTHLVPLALIALLSVIFLDQTRYVDGGSELARFIHDRNVKHLVVAGYERNPQLSYYLSGADLGWESPITFERIVPPRNQRDFKEWLTEELSSVASGTLVVLEKDKFIRYKTINPQLIMPQSFMPVFDSRRYSAWVRRPSETLALSGERNPAE